MTKEETKKAIEIMQGFCDGKTIQVKYKEKGEWVDTDGNCIPCWNWVGYDYRIKPEKHIRPYTFEEMCKAVKTHGVLVKSKVSREVFTITGFDKFNVLYSADCCESYNMFWSENVWFDDNSPCGIEEE